MQFERLDMSDSQLITSKVREKSTSARLCCFAVFSTVIVVSVGACRVQECGLESGEPSNNNQSEVAAKQAAEKKRAERLGLSGVPNLHKVSEDLYRGA